MKRSFAPRLNWLLGLLIVVAVLAFDVPNRLLARMAYAVESGQIQADTDQLARAGEVSNAFRLVAKIARPGVVSITASAGERTTAAWERLDEQERELKQRWSTIEKWVEEDADAGQEAAVELLRELQELERERERLHERLAAGTGSGVVYDGQGHILTNNHVVDARTDITVQLSDRREYAARLVGADPETDLALLKIDAAELHPLNFGDSDKMEVGDWVLAVGAPFGLSQSVTHGIVSARGRTNINTGSRRIIYQDFIQTDAAINPGNSGGPLMNLRGEVIGLNTAIATNGDSYNAGIAFTIPSNMATKIAEKLKTTGEVARGWLGVTMDALEPEDLRIFSDDTRGVLIQSVLSNSPADRAGFQSEDLVVSIGSHPVKSDDEMLAVIADIFPGETATFEIIRGGERMELSPRLGRRPADVQAARFNDGFTNSIELAALGARVRTLRPSVAELNDFESGDHGAYVYGLEEPIDNLELGDLIVACNGAPVPTAGHLARALSNVRSGRAVDLSIKGRDGRTRTIQIKR